jgi:hypothetical protein
MLLPVSLVDTEALVESVVAAAVVGVGVIVAFALAVYGAARFADERRTGASGSATFAVVLTLVALAACAIAVAAGLVIIIADRS